MPFGLDIAGLDTTISMCRENNIVISSDDLYCLLPQCEALHTGHSNPPITTIISIEGSIGLSDFL